MKRGSRQMGIESKSIENAAWCLHFANLHPKIILEHASDNPICVAPSNIVPIDTWTVFWTGTHVAFTILSVYASRQFLRRIVELAKFAQSTAQLPSI